MLKYIYILICLTLCFGLGACSGCGNSGQSESAAGSGSKAVKQAKKQDKVELNGLYNAIIAPDKVKPDFEAASRASLIRFTFNPDGTLLYEVAAMGNQNSDTGKYRLSGDKLVMYDLGRGPDSEFSIQVMEDGRIRLDGPNSFILTKANE